MLKPPEDSKRQSPSLLSRQIRNLRDKFDSLGEENCPAAETDSDADPVRSFIVSVRNPTREPRSFKEAQSNGKVMAALLIGSIQSMPLEIIGNAEPTSPVPSSNEQSNDEETKLCEEEAPADAEEEAVSGGDVKAAQQLARDVSSSIGETEMSSFDEDNSSPDDDSSEDNTNYNLLRDSKYSLDGDYSDRAGDSPSSRERTGRSSADSRTDSTLQVDSDATYRMSSNPKLASAASVGLRNDEIPIITVDFDESTDSDASRLLPSDENPSPDPSTPRDPTDTDVVVLAAVHSPVDKSLDAPPVSGGQRPSLKVVEEDERRGSSATPGSDGSSHGRMHRVHLTRHQRDLCRARSLSAQGKGQSPSPNETESRVSADQKDDDSSRKTTDVVGLSYEEMCARASVERRRSMLDLIKLIDAKMMVPERAITRHDKSAVSLRSKRRKREIPTLLERSSSRAGGVDGASTRRRHRGRHERDVSFRMPRVCSTPDCLSSGQRLITSFRPTSRSCDSSLLSLTACGNYRRHHHRYRHHRHRRHHHHHHNNPHTRVSPNSKRTVLVAPSVAIDRRSDDAPEISRRSLESRDKADVIASSDAHDGARSEPTATNINPPVSQPSSRRDATATVAIRKCSSVCNLGGTLCHIDSRTVPTNTANMTYNSCVSRPFPDLRQQDEAASSVSPSYPLVPSVAAKVSQSPATRTLANVPLHRRSSDSDLSVTPKGGWFPGVAAKDRINHDWIFSSR